MDIGNDPVTASDRCGHIGMLLDTDAGTAAATLTQQTAGRREVLKRRPQTFVG
jgi:hypothetical protein